jgi:hypothetical protein
MNGALILLGVGFGLFMAAQLLHAYASGEAAADGN